MIERLLGRSRGDRAHGPVRRPYVRPATKYRHLGLERVEDRLLLAVVPLTDMESFLADSAAAEGRYLVVSGENAFYAAGVCGGLQQDVRFKDSSAVIADGDDATPAIQDEPSRNVELIAIAPEDLLPCDIEGGLVDLTRVVNESVLALDQLEIARGLPKTEIAGDDDMDAGVSTGNISIDGSRGRSQAFDLAMIPEGGVKLGVFGLDIESHASTTSNVGRELPTEKTEFGQVENRLPMGDAHPADFAGSSFPALATTDTTLSGSVTATDSQAGDPSAAHLAVFAEIDRSTDGPTLWPAYLDRNRQFDAIPLLAVAVAAGQLARQRRNTRDESPTCQLPPRRRP